MNIVKPIIERRLKQLPSDDERKKATRSICNYLTNYSPDFDEPLQKKRYYEALESLLLKKDSNRILFYIPLKTLNGASRKFKKVYMNAWYELLNVQDIRANFYDGDCFEDDARPKEGLERVVKCVHLLPWLVEAGYITSLQIADILATRDDDIVLMRSFKEAFSVIKVRDSFGDSGREVSRLFDFVKDVPDRIEPQPLYVSQRRIKWLKEKEQRELPHELLTPGAKLSGPFSSNLIASRSKIKEIESTLGTSDIVLISGSRLKGYATTESDFDIWHYHDLVNDSVFYLGSPHAAHIYLVSAWISGSSVTNLEEISNEVAGIYSKLAFNDSFADTRRHILERLEMDLLQYRLLHKGFSRHTGRFHFETSSYLEIDGDCPFYDDEYRGVATMLFAKYVWI